MKIFSIRDNKAEYYKPFLHKTPGEALRAFMDLVADKQTEIGRYPHDFTLYEHGDIDEQTGAIESYEAPKHLANGQDFLQEA